MWRYLFKLKVAFYCLTEVFGKFGDVTWCLVLHKCAFVFVDLSHCWSINLCLRILTYFSWCIIPFTIWSFSKHFRYMTYQVMIFVGCVNVWLIYFPMNFLYGLRLTYWVFCNRISKVFSSPKQNWWTRKMISLFRFWFGLEWYRLFLLTRVVLTQWPTAYLGIYEICVQPFSSLPIFFYLFALVSILFHVFCQR